ncbi:MAG: hypothetical protein FWE83_03335 [Oscillospiraceae bacterium]|nr:hypothetical protein [Oscillospiraceae bacterium]
MKITIDGIEALIENTDKYLQINDIKGTDFPAVRDKLNIDYAGYDKWFCFRNVEIPFAVLDELGAVLEDDCIQMFLNADKNNGIERFC